MREQLKALLQLLTMNTSAFEWSAHTFNGDRELWVMGFFPTDNSDFVEVYQGTIDGCISEALTTLKSISATRALEARIIEAKKSE